MLGLSEFGTTEQFDFDKDEEVEDNDEEEDEQQALVIWFWFFFVFLVSFFGFGYLIFGFDFLGLGICSGFDFFSKQICSPLVPALSEPGKIEMYSPAFYATCTAGGILNCGLTRRSSVFSFFFFDLILLYISLLGLDLCERRESLGMSHERRESLRWKREFEMRE